MEGELALVLIYLRRSIVFSGIIYFFIYMMLRRGREEISSFKMVCEYIFVGYTIMFLQVTLGGTIHRILNSNMALLRGKYVNIIPFYEIIRFIIKKGNYERLIQFFLNILICMPIGILLPLVFSERNWNLKKIFNITTIITFSVEVIQYFTGRMADVDDIIANILGGLIGFIAIYMVRYYINKK